MKSGFPQKLAISLLSILLIPLTAAAADVNKSLRIGNIGEGTDAYVDISSAGKGLTAVPYIRISGSPEEKAKEAERKVETGNLSGKTLNNGRIGEKFDPADGEISLSNGARFLKEARKNLKSGIKRDSRPGKSAGPGGKVDEGGNARRDDADIVVCENCAIRAPGAETLIQ